MSPDRSEALLLDSFINAIKGRFAAYLLENIHGLKTEHVNMLSEIGFGAAIEPAFAVGAIRWLIDEYQIHGIVTT